MFPSLLYLLPLITYNCPLSPSPHLISCLCIYSPLAYSLCVISPFFLYWLSFLTFSLFLFLPPSSCLLHLSPPPVSSPFFPVLLSPLLVSSPISVEEVNDTQVVCQTGSSNQTGGVIVRVLFGKAERTIPGVLFRYFDDPIITDARPAESFYA